MTLKPSWDTNKSSVFKTYGTINFGGDFQKKYGLITFLHQTRRGVSDTIFGNDSASFGSFKNHYYKSSCSGVSLVLKKYREVKRTRAFVQRVVDFNAHYSSHGSYLYCTRVPSAFLVAEMKSKFLSPVFDNYFSASLYNSIFNERFKDKLLGNITQALFFVRTPWYFSTLDQLNYDKPFSFIENTGVYRSLLAKSDRYHWGFAGEEDVSFFSTLGSWVSDKFDVVKELRIASRGGVYRRHVKKYIS